MIDLFSEFKRFGIFGPSESGKTTLAKKISLHLWQQEKRPSLVLDPVAKSAWGEHATVYTDETQFWKDIFKKKDSLVIVEDASVTINRDNELNGVFTTLRHQEHKLLVIGHGAQNLLPQMRQQLQRVFLFLQTPDSVKQFQSDFPNCEITIATQLRQYEFITFANFKSVLRFRTTV